MLVSSEKTWQAVKFSPPLLTRKKAAIKTNKLGEVVVDLISKEKFGTNKLNT